MQRHFKNRVERLRAALICTAGVAALAGCTTTAQLTPAPACPDIQPPRIKTVEDLAEAFAIYRNAFFICAGKKQEEKGKTQ